MSRWSLLATDTTSPTGGSPLRGRYLATNRMLRALMAASDLLMVPLRLRRRRRVDTPRRVLLSIGGHLGDAVIAAAAVARLAEAAPEAEIGVLMPAWSSVVFEGDQRITHRHVVDHWYLDRGPGNLVRKWLAYRRTRRRAIASMRAVGYEAAVDLYDYFPNAALMLWHTRVPIRIGFDAAGFSALYTHPVQWPADQRHTADRQAMLLRMLFPAIGEDRAPASVLPDAPATAAASVEKLLDRYQVPVSGFTLVHAGAGSPGKNWPVERWREVVERLSADGAVLVFTGRGDREHEIIRSLVRGLPRAVDLCDQLEWWELVQVIRLARHVLSVDTVVAHIAGAVGTPATTLWTSPSSPDHWRPLGSATVILGGDEPRTPAPGGSSVLVAGEREITATDVVAELSRVRPAPQAVPGSSGAVR